MMEHTTLQSLLSFALVFKTATSVIQPRYQYTLSKQVSMPSEMTNCTFAVKVSQMDCFRSCAAVLHCTGVYLTSVQTDGDIVWNCSQCENTPPVGTNFSEGVGIAGRIKRFSTPPEITHGTLLKTDLVNGIQAAFYHCSPGGAKTFRLAFDQKIGIWPQLNDACTQTICQQHSLKASMVTVKNESNGFTFLPACQADETADGNIRWQSDGTWHLTSTTRVLCVSPTCTRLSDRKRLVYNGVRATADDGRTCQRWDAQSPHSHSYGGLDLFLEDGRTDHNFCRDPGPDGYLWCYTIDPGKRYTMCTVPECV